MMKTRAIGLVLAFSLVFMTPGTVFAEEVPEDQISVAQQIQQEDETVSEEAAVPEEEEVPEEENQTRDKVCLMSAAGVNPTTIAPNGSYSSSLTSTVDTRAFTITLSTAGRLSMDLNTKITKMEFELLEGTYSSGSRLDSDYPDKGSESYEYDLKPGKYTLVFERYSLNYTGSFSFTTSFTSARETYTAENNTINAVRAKAAVPFDKLIRGQIADNDKIDYYRISVPRDGRVRINIHSDIDRVEYGLFDADSDSVSRYNSFDKGDGSDWFDLTAGDYYLYFERYYSYDTGNYNFKLRYTDAKATYSREDNSLNAARSNSAISLSKTVTGQIACNDDTDIYRIVVPKSGYYRLSVNSRIREVALTICDGNGNDFWANRHYHNKGRASYNYYLRKGTWFIEFDRYSSNTGTYSFSLAPKGTRVTKASGARRVVKVRWKKASGSGYQIQIAENSKYTKGLRKVTVSRNSKTARTITHLKAKKKYYIRIRTFVKKGGVRYYSNWSGSKTFKTK